MKGKLGRFFLVIIFCFNAALIFAKTNVIEIGEYIYPENTPRIKDADFIFLDFWATWCGPCIKAMDHLETLRNACGDKIKFVSISNEPSETVRRFFANKPKKGIIAVDFQGKTFENFSVQSIPYAVILAPDGQVIWKGNPNSLDAQVINEITSKKYKVTPLSQKLLVHPATSTETSAMQPDVPFSGVDFKAVFYPSITNLSFNKLTTKEKILISGNIKSILAELAGVREASIFLEPDSLTYGTIEVFPKPYFPHLKTVFNTLCKKLNYNILIDTIKAEASFLKITNPDNLWGNEVYQWSEDSTSSFLMDEFAAQFDNYTLTDVCKVLSKVLDREIKYVGEDITSRDWNLVIDSFENLRQQMLDDYGVEMTSDNVYMVNYHLRKQ